MSWPATLQINAWNGGAVAAETGVRARQWALTPRLTNRQAELFPPALDPNEWRDKRNGWGLVLPEPAGDHGMSTAALATADDQPEAIRRLVQHRAVGGVSPPIFRFKPDVPLPFSKLLNYQTGSHPDIAGAPEGIGEGRIPRFLLFYGSPERLPWELQMLLNTRCCAGRLDLTPEEGLDRYVDALISDDWGHADADVARSVIWAVDRGPDDITRLMRDAVADRIATAYGGDGDLATKCSYVDGCAVPATAARLIDALRPSAARPSPGMVITTSHGLTDATLTPAQQITQIGLPVDQTGVTLDVTQLLSDWKPRGAIWYSHACCSAGGTDLSVFDGLSSSKGDIDSVLKAVTAFTKAAGACVAPLPRRLLGAEHPLRAFVGHVEPTFDWTLRQPATGQYLTDGLKQAFYDQIYTGATIGVALRQWFGQVGTLFGLYGAQRKAYSSGSQVEDELLRFQLAQRDVMSTVIIGDPTVRLIG